MKSTSFVELLLITPHRCSRTSQRNSWRPKLIQKSKSRLTFFDRCYVKD